MRGWEKEVSNEEGRKMMGGVEQKKWENKHVGEEGIV